MRFNLLAVLIGIILILPGTTLAQLLGNTDGETAFTVSVRPQNLEPNKSATISFLSASIDLTNAIVTVSIAGKVLYKGAVQPISIALGKAGSVTSVKVTISSGGIPYTQTLFLQPQDVVLITEPISSAPPLYLGMPSVPIEGGVRIVAMANLRDARGKTIDPAALSYSWTVNDAQIANSSGIGKQSIMVASPLQYRARPVSVRVMSQDGSLFGGASLSLVAEEPSVRIYQNDPLLGIRFDRALLGGYAIATAETALYGAPFSMPTSSGAPLLEWFLNGASVQTGNSVTLRPAGDGEGGASLSLVASSNSYTKAAAELSLSFGSKPGFNVFGL